MERWKSLQRLKLFLSMSLSISPFYGALLVLRAAVGGGQMVASVVFMKWLVDELAGEKDLRRLVSLGILIVIANVAFRFLEKTLKQSIEVGKSYVSDKMNEAMAEKIMNIDYAYLENPYYLDLKERASFAIYNQNSLEWVIQSTAEVLEKGAVVASYTAILFTLSPVLMAILAVGILLNLLCYQMYSKYQVALQQAVIPFNRKYNYYIGLCDERELQKDVRLYDMGDMLAGRVMEYGREIAAWLGQVMKRQGAFKAQTDVINVLQTAVCYGYIGLRALTGRFGERISIGSFTMYVSAALGFATTVVELGEEVVQLMAQLSYLEPFAEFMAIKEEWAQTEGSLPFEGSVETIEFDSVTFAYPGSEKEVLKNISFQVKKGEKISIVGLNGAGKSTLVKLLCRLYKPNSGEIRVNGKNIFDYDYSSYMQTVAAVFQDYKLFAFTLQENITGKEKEEKDAKEQERLWRVLGEVGIASKITEVPKGLEALYGTEYDEGGVLLSGGESQKIAIARALYKDGSLVIMDEPASALDPISEAEIYEKFNAMVAHKTALYISHRMSSSVFCDKVLVIDGGKVADFDTHEHLMKKTDSLYCKLFQSQADNYQISV